MPIHNGFRTLNIRNETHGLIKNEAVARGMKMWTLTDQIVEKFLRQEGEQLKS